MLSMLLDLCLTDKEKYGTKASALGELMKSGVQVPNGFALSSEFFMKFLEYNKFHYNSEDYLAYNVEIYNFILNGEFSSEMEADILEFFNNIQNKEAGGNYAVRSSALCEDNDAYSMAGMFSSFINLNSFEEVKISIKKCFASLFKDKVIGYFVKNDLNFKDLKMCVIIQQFVVGEYSGVNFSADTIDMDKDIMHINAVNGLCDDYVSGKVSSAFYKINKKTGEMLEERIPENFLKPSRNIIDSL
ncbi:MAG: PEP/pyruvate-binding domain-containing protein [Clostridium sp.]|uniref:PEP/pyruvate-binding domain-containing protein n=1 Tax=Clostridium sp. TaxID=1506 RepID=UPI003D6D33DB